MRRQSDGLLQNKRPVVMVGGAYGAELLLSLSSCGRGFGAGLFLSLSVYCAVRGLGVGVGWCAGQKGQSSVCRRVS